MRPCSEELGNRLQTPTLIGCIFLRNRVGSHSTLRLVFACFAAMSEALNYGRFWQVLSNLRVSTVVPGDWFRYRNPPLDASSRALNSIPVFLSWSTHKPFLSSVPVSPPADLRVQQSPELYTGFSPSLIGGPVFLSADPFGRLRGVSVSRALNSSAAGRQCAADTDFCSEDGSR